MRSGWLAALFLVAFSVSCGGPAVDLTKGVQFVDVTSGWLDVGIVDGQNKLVPSLTFKLKNTSDQSLNVLQANVVFHRGTDADEWGNAFLPIAGSEGLAPGATSKSFTANSQQGYKSTEPRADMLKSQYFIDARAEVSVKYAANAWQKCGDFPITRQIITR